MVSMASIVVGVFDEYANAEAARDELLDAGLRESQIRIVQRERPEKTEQQSEHSGFWENIRDYFGIDEDEQDEAPEGRLLGGAVMTVLATSANLEIIGDIIQRHEPESMQRQDKPESESGPAARDEAEI